MDKNIHCTHTMGTTTILDRGFKVDSLGKLLRRKPDAIRAALRGEDLAPHLYLSPPLPKVKPFARGASWFTPRRESCWYLSVAGCRKLAAVLGADPAPVEAALKKVRF